MALIRIDHRPKTTSQHALYSSCLIVSENSSLADYVVLLLLHGIADDSSGWARYTNVETLVREKPLVVVMPSAGQFLYDMDNGQAYYSYLTEELPHYLENSSISTYSKKCCCWQFHVEVWRLQTGFPQRFPRLCAFWRSPCRFSISKPQSEKKPAREFDLIFGGLDTYPSTTTLPPGSKKHASSRITCQSYPWLAEQKTRSCPPVVGFTNKPSTGVCRLPTANPPAVTTGFSGVNNLKFGLKLS